MNLHRMLRPALRTLTAGLVTAVAVTTLAAPSATTAAPEGDSASKPTISAGKEGLKKRVASLETTTPTSGSLDLIAVTASPAVSSGSYEGQVGAAVNAVRRQHGLRSLTWQRCTDRMAEGWSAMLASTGGFYHRSMSTVLRGCHARYAGETLGRGQISPQTLVSMWMNSPAHRNVLLSSKATRLGVGATPNRNGEWVVAANFTRF